VHPTAALGRDNFSLNVRQVIQKSSAVAACCVDTTARIVRFCITSDQGKLAARRGRKASGTGPYFKSEVKDSGVTRVIDSLLRAERSSTMISSRMLR